MGVTKDDEGVYKLNTGTTAMPGKDMQVYIKGGKSEIANGKTFVKKTDKSLGGLGSTEYTDKTIALTKCAASSSCKGVVKKPNGKYVIATQTKLATKTGYTTYEMGRLVSSGMYFCTLKTDRFLINNIFRILTNV